MEESANEVSENLRMDWARSREGVISPSKSVGKSKGPSAPAQGEAERISMKFLAVPPAAKWTLHEVDVTSSQAEMRARERHTSMRGC